MRNVVHRSLKPQLKAEKKNLKYCIFVFYQLLEPMLFVILFFLQFGVESERLNQIHVPIRAHLFSCVVQVLGDRL
jgi:hypothetical protein